MIFFSQKQKIKNSKKGFTLLELMIVSSIFAVITSVILIRFSLFNSRILITNLAYDIALSVRQAQTYGINVRGFGSGESIIFNTGYGIHFDAATPTSYILFADLNDDKDYTINELVESISLRGGNYLSDFCGTTSLANENCSSTDEITELDIVFKRPDPDAYINSHSPVVVYQYATIKVSSPQGLEKEIKVYSTGQISVGGI
jgi:prepilin-type N-terminal cleavage/methylation domain-containing protein